MLLGMLIYVLRTRPDISYSVNRLVTRSSVSTDKDWQGLQRIAAYLRTTYRNGDEHAQRHEQLRLHHKVTSASWMSAPPEQDGSQDKGRRNA